MKPNVYATAQQAQAVRHLINLLEEHAPRGINVRSFMWPQIQIAQTLAKNIEMAAVASKQLIATKGEKA